MKLKKLQLFLMGILAMPMAMADGEDVNFAQGIYYGILRFFSGTLNPLVALLFLIFTVLIILGIGFILKKIFNLLSHMAG
jgi:hypothetical protein